MKPGGRCAHRSASVRKPVVELAKPDGGDELRRVLPFTHPRRLDRSQRSFGLCRSRSRCPGLRRATLQWCGGIAGDLPALRVHCDRAAATCHGGRHLKTERLSRKVYRTREDARAVVFDYIERFYNPLENLRS
jgi:hypothetical protein